MNVLWHWVPALAGGVVLAVVGFVLLAQIRREERNAQHHQADKPGPKIDGA